MRANSHPLFRRRRSVSEFKGARVPGADKSNVIDNGGVWRDCPVACAWYTHLAECDTVLRIPCRTGQLHDVRLAARRECDVCWRIGFVEDGDPACAGLFG